MVKLVEMQITEGRHYQGLCSHDLMEVGRVRKGKILRGDITPSDVLKKKGEGGGQKRNVIVTLGTGIAPFIWMIDHLSEGGRQGKGEIKE